MLKSEDKIYDIKSASPYAYEHKFTSWDSLASSDDFGYMGQGFGYARADGTKFGGWIVINKATGQFKVIEIPEELHDYLADKYFKETEQKVKHIIDDLPMPPCTGVEEETYYKKPTGNKILGPSCRFCSHKDKCWPDVKYAPSKVSKSGSPKYVYYVETKED